MTYTERNLRTISSTNSSRVVTRNERLTPMTRTSVRSPKTSSVSLRTLNRNNTRNWKTSTDPRLRKNSLNGYPMRLKNEVSSTSYVGVSKTEDPISNSSISNPKVVSTRNIENSMHKTGSPLFDN